MRKYYLDNLRFITVLFLFPYHASMIYNSFGENFYVRGPQVRLLNDFILVVSPWFMPLMFVIAGISSAYALKKRTAKQFIKERFFRLFIPLVFGILIYVPSQTYFAERFHNQYSGGYLEQYLLFFTKPTDLTGYTGGFTPAHLWFILYLFIISILALPIMTKYIKSSRKINFDKLSIPVILLLFLIPLILAPIFEPGGKSLGQYFAFYLLGFFILSEDVVIERLEKLRLFLVLVSLLLLASVLILFYNNLGHGLLYDIYYRLIMWISILAILSIGKRHLNFSNRITSYLSKAAFPIYFFHQTWVIVSAYYIFNISSVTAVQFLLILLFSVLITFLNYEIFRRIPITRQMFGIKK